MFLVPYCSLELSRFPFFSFFLSSQSPQPFSLIFREMKSLKKFPCTTISSFIQRQEISVLRSMKVFRLPGSNGALSQGLLRICLIVTITTLNLFQLFSNFMSISYQGSLLLPFPLSPFFFFLFSFFSSPLSKELLEMMLDVCEPSNRALITPSTSALMSHFIELMLRFFFLAILPPII